MSRLLFAAGAGFLASVVVLACVHYDTPAEDSPEAGASSDASSGEGMPMSDGGIDTGVVNDAAVSTGCVVDAEAFTFCDSFDDAATSSFVPPWADLSVADGGALVRSSLHAQSTPNGLSSTVPPIAAASTAQTRDAFLAKRFGGEAHEATLEYAIYVPPDGVHEGSPLTLFSSVGFIDTVNQRVIASMAHSFTVTKPGGELTVMSRVFTNTGSLGPEWQVPISTWHTVRRTFRVLASAVVETTTFDGVEVSTVQADLTTVKVGRIDFGVGLVAAASPDAGHAGATVFFDDARILTRQ